MISSILTSNYHDKLATHRMCMSSNCHFGSSSKLESRVIFLRAACHADVFEEGSWNKLRLESRVVASAERPRQSHFLVVLAPRGA